jgi:hypothetical protein
MEAPLPPELANVLRPTLPRVADEVVGAIGREVPEYARPLEGPFGQALRVGVEQALAGFVEGIAHPERDDSEGHETYVALGRGEMRAGRALEVLLKAYRIGARISWEHCLRAGQAAGYEPDVLYRLASGIFEYIDRISGESVEGYTAEQSAALAQRQRHRRALVRALARDDVEPERIRELAQMAAWEPPASVAGLVAREADADRLVSRLGGHAIAATEEDLALVVIPDPDAPGRRGELRAALRDDRAALGPTVTLERTARSLARARAALRLLEGGVLPKGATPLVTDDHLPELLLHGDEALAGDLTTRALAPLQELAPGTRTRLATTLRAWLDEPGQVTRIAERLHVHPQTVRYRVAQLRELFGQRLEEPECRFELALALRLAGDDGLR